MAKFETPDHRYADLSDGSYGVALLNDCKYGYAVEGRTLSLNLLRSPAYPDPDADRHEHSFTYSLLPHRGQLTDSDVIEEAAMLNVHPLAIYGYTAQAVEPPIRMKSKGDSLEALKKGEKRTVLFSVWSRPGAAGAVRY